MVLSPLRRLTTLVGASIWRSCVCRGLHASAMTVWDDKKAVRKSTSKALKALDDSLLREQSEKIVARVLQSAFFQQSKSTGIYLTCPKLREVDTSRLLEAMLAQGEEGRRCYAPTVEDKNSNMDFLHVDSLDGVQEMPPYGIKEPTGIYSDGRPRDNVLRMEIPLDLLIMTGQAFDRSGGRLGRGGGYYDKFIARCVLQAKKHNREPPLLVALAFEEQVIEGQLPKTENDADMDVLVLPGEVLACSERGSESLSKAVQS